jgi:hypothetical protein
MAVSATNLTKPTLRFNASECEPRVVARFVSDESFIYADAGTRREHGHDKHAEPPEEEAPPASLTVLPLADRLSNKARNKPKVRREDAERFIEEVRGDEPELAPKLWVEERELGAGGLN